MTERYELVLTSLFGDCEAPELLKHPEYFHHISDDYDPPDYFLCNDLQLVTRPRERLALLLGDAAAARAAGALLLFAKGEGGCGYALWRLEQSAALDGCPVVYLDGEGDGSEVVASDLRGFFALVACGFDRIASQTVQWMVSNPDEPRQSTRGCRLFERFEIGPEEDPVGAMGKAAAEHPDFKAWLEGL